jgi:hypothetical protein
VCETSERYNYAIVLNMVAIYDSTALVDTAFRMEDYILWNISSRICVRIYWEDKEKFLTSLAMA